MIELRIQFDGLEYSIPVNPRDITISQSATNTNLDIIGLGKITRKGEPGLRTLQIKSFFPCPSSVYYSGISANTYIEFIEKIWDTENINNKVAWLYSLGGINEDMGAKPLNMYFVIDKFDYTYKGGDFDTEYTLSIKEYKKYGVENIENNFAEGMQSARIPSTVKRNIPGFMQETHPTTTAKTYQTGIDDTLWKIAKKCTGDGSNWKSLYELNKTIIGDDPENLPQGITLTLPENWNSSTASVNTGTSINVNNYGNNTAAKINTATATTEKEEEKTAELDVEQAFKLKKMYDYIQRTYADNQREIDYFYTERNKFMYGDSTKVYPSTSWAIWKQSGDSIMKKSQQNIQHAENIYNDESKTYEERMTALQEIRDSENALANRIGDLEFSYLGFDESKKNGARKYKIEENGGSANI